LIKCRHRPHDNHVRVSDDAELATAILGSLDGLLRGLDMEQIGEDRFRVPSDVAAMFDHIYGGQLLAQALVAAGTTVPDKTAHSLHAAFVKAGVPGRSIEVVVSRVRDGRTMATRQIAVLQDGETLLVGFASFHLNNQGPDVTDGPPEVPRPEDTPTLQQWVQQLPPDLERGGRHWIDRPPPLDLRLPEPPAFLGGKALGATRSHWMRPPRPVGGDQLLHAALLAYASDFFLMDMIFRAHPAGLGPGTVNGFSVDHAIWFHRPVAFDDWHLHTQEAVTIFGDRGLARGAIHDQAGHLVASVMQEVLVRPHPNRT
jgi:acyl-CoA thioesterase-2